MTAAVDKKTANAFCVPKLMKLKLQLRIFLLQFFFGSQKQLVPMYLMICFLLSRIKFCGQVRSRQFGCTERRLSFIAGLAQLEVFTQPACAPPFHLLLQHCIFGGAVAQFQLTSIEFHVELVVRPQQLLRLVVVRLRRKLCGQVHRSLRLLRFVTLSTGLAARRGETIHLILKLRLQQIMKVSWRRHRCLRVDVRLHERTLALLLVERSDPG